MRFPRRLLPVAALATALAFTTPALPALAADPTPADPTPADSAKAGADVQTAQLDLAQAQQVLREATDRTRRITSRVIQLSAEQSSTAVTLAEARRETRSAVQAAYNDALIDPTANLLAAFDGQDPGIADQVRRRKLVRASTRAEELTQQTERLASLSDQLATQRRAAVQAGAEAVSAAAQAQRKLAEAQRTERVVRRRVELAAQQRELKRLNDELLETLAAAYTPPERPSTADPGTVTLMKTPAELLNLYQRAANTCPGLPWGVLAGIGQVETGHGQNKNVSSAGAMGPMQFLPSTWTEYGVDGDGDGKADILDQADAVFSAAHLLCSNGAGDRTRLYSAIYGYNHSDYYVNLVLSLASKYEAGSITP